MPQAETNRYELRIKEETAPGVPATGAPDTVRNTGSDLKYDKSTTPSDEIRSDTQNADVMEVGGNSGGSINVELSMGTYDTFFEALLGSIFSTKLVGAVSTLTVTKATRRIQSSGTAFANAVVGQWVFVAGMVASSGINNGWWRIDTITDNSDITVLDPDGKLVDEVGSGDETVKGSVLRDGTTVKEYSIEKAYLDLSPVLYEHFKAQRFDSMSISAASQSKVTMSFNTVGRGVAVSNSGTAFSANPSAAGTNPVVNATHNLGSVMIDGSELTTAIQSISAEYSRNLDAKNAVKNLAPIGYRFGTQSLTGSIVAYFEDLAQYNKFLNHTELGVSYAFQDSSGRRIRFTYDSVYFTSGGSPATSGKNQDALQTLGFEAKRNSTYGCQIQIDVVDV